MQSPLNTTTILNQRFKLSRFICDSNQTCNSWRQLCAYALPVSQTICSDMRTSSALPEAIKVVETDTLDENDRHDDYVKVATNV